MFSKKNIFLGPIFGHTTSAFSTIWVKGKRKHSVQIRWKQGSDEWQTKKIELNNNLDNTGTTKIEFVNNFDELEVELALIKKNEDIKPVSDKIWGNNKIRKGNIKPAPSSNEAEFSFIFGSCSHRGYGPLRKGDKTFKTILNDDHHKDAAFMVMAGDQVYADHLISKTIPLLPAAFANNAPRSKSGYFKKYRSDFSQKNLSRLFSKIPTYMILDDHEIENNWSGYNYKEKTKKSSLLKPFASWKEKTLKRGLTGYLAYQASHSPVFSENQDAIPKKLSELGSNCGHWGYSFSHGLADFLVLDVRSERTNPRKSGAKMIDKQVTAIKDLLNNSKDRIKFIVSPVPMAPDTNEEFDKVDTWKLYPKQRNEILDLIKNYDGIRPIFLGGDLHQSGFYEIKSHHEESENLVIPSLVSSAFNWIVYGVQNQHSTDRHVPRIELGKLPTSTQDVDSSPDNRDGEYYTKIINKVCTDNNFMKIKVTSSEVIAEIYNGHSGKLHEQAWTINKESLIT